MSNKTKNFLSFCEFGKVGKLYLKVLGVKFIKRGGKNYRVQKQHMPAHFPLWSHWIIYIYKKGFDNTPYSIAILCNRKS